MGKKYEARMVRMQERDKDVLSRAKSLVADFMEHIEDTGECWLYTPYNRLGYGDFYYRVGHKASAHRVALLIFTGSYPKNGIYYACHKCDHKHCVNPDHLYWGTPRDNINDAWAEPIKRTDEWRIAKQYHERFTDAQITEMWNLYWHAGMSQGDIASRFNCNSRYIAAVMNGIYRSHVTRRLTKPEKRRMDYASRGENSPRALLTENQVQAIRRALALGVTQTDLALISRVQRPHIRSIETGRLWAHLPWPEGVTPPDRETDSLRAPPAAVRCPKTQRAASELTKKDAVGIWQAYWQDNGNQRDIARQFGTNNSIVSQIVNRKWHPEWTSHLKENKARKRLLSSTPRPLRAGNCKVTPDQVQDIRQRIMRGESSIAISETIGCSVDIVYGIKKKQTWPRLPWPEKTASNKSQPNTSEGLSSA